MAKKKKRCAGGFIRNDQQFFFGKRSAKKTWAPCLWDIIGGHAHKNENIYEALRRETFEEAGIVVHDAVLLTVMEVLDESADDFFEYHIYMITAYEGQPVNCSDEHTETGWFTLVELRTMPLALPIYISLIGQWLNSNVTDKHHGSL